MGKDIPILENKNNQWIFLLPLIIMSVLAMALFPFFGINRSLWLDEAFGVFTASHDFEGIIRAVKSDASPPLYYLLLAVWIWVFGISELAVRSLSAIFYMLSLAAVYVSGKSIYNDRKTGLLCSFLYMLSPLAIKHAQNARMYSLVGLLVILSTLFFLRLFLIKTNSKKDLALYIIVNMIGTFTHYWFFFTIFSQIVSYLLLLFSRSSFKKFSAVIFISFAPFLILWIPVFLPQANRVNASWIGKPGIRELVSTLLDFCGGWSGKRAALVYAVFLTLIVFKVEGFKIRFWNISALKGFIIQKQTLVFLILLSVSLLVPFIISQVKPIYVPTRYTIIALPPFVMLVGSLLSRFGNKHVVLACCYILLIETSISFVSYRTTPKQCSDKSTTEYLIKHADDNDILIHTGLSRLPIDYYLRLMKSGKSFIELSFPQELALHPGWQDVNKMLSQKHMLESEADSVVSRIADILIKNNNTKIWLLNGGNAKIGEILKHRLDTRFFLREKKDLRSGTSYTFHNYIFKEVKDMRRPLRTFYYNHIFWDDNVTFYNELFVYQNR